MNLLKQKAEDKMEDFKEYQFLYGESFDDSNLYVFQNESGMKIYVSEKLDKFIHGKSSKYLLFEIERKHDEIKEYIYRDSEEYNKMITIKPIVDNLGGITVQCSNCKKIVLKEQIRSLNNDKCVYCDLYMCKKCRKLKPLIELDSDRLCDKCREEKK